MNVLATLYCRQGRYEESERLLLETLVIAQWQEHPMTLETRSNLAHGQQSRRELHYVSDLEYLDDNVSGFPDPRSP